MIELIMNYGVTYHDHGITLEDEEVWKLKSEIEALSKELSDVRKVAGCALQSWTSGQFDAAGNQRSLAEFSLGDKERQ